MLATIAITSLQPSASALWQTACLPIEEKRLSATIVWPFLHFAPWGCERRGLLIVAAPLLNGASKARLPHQDGCAVLLANLADQFPQSDRNSAFSRQDILKKPSRSAFQSAALFRRSLRTA
ncbi:MAG: hypothetical protein EOQ28_09480 [Mesorhizobium sp.]|uniref:hypothetical protein n=1 Tax=Mesorhizobium sp. TaxID=1871066 RepID=UPI000FE7AD19|nr:hypothetical protein [Mesorhizobium sp.]RWA75317.1 MAG: hypothetical protein EOQ28_09480 [Mesorhizobium sp.]